MCNVCVANDVLNAKDWYILYKVGLEMQAKGTRAEGCYAEFRLKSNSKTSVWHTTNDLAYVITVLGVDIKEQFVVQRKRDNRKLLLHAKTPICVKLEMRHRESKK